MVEKNKFAIIFCDFTSLIDFKGLASVCPVPGLIQSAPVCGSPAVIAISRRFQSGFGIRPASGNRRIRRGGKNNVCFRVNRFRRTGSLPPPDVGAGPTSGMSEEIERI